MPNRGHKAHLTSPARVVENRSPLRENDPVTWWMLAAILVLAARITYAALRFRQIKASGQQVRWEWPLSRWIRKLTDRP